MAREWDVYPNIFYTHFHNGELLKYKYTKSEITFENILSFIQDIENRKIEPFKLSEPEPVDNKKKLV